MNARFDTRRLRRTILKMAFAGSAVHVPCAFSIVEILAVLYRSFVRLQTDDPRWRNRDHVLLSKGHGVMAQYACLHELGWIDAEELEHYFADGARLKGLADAHVPGVDVTAGSLGHGLSVGVGLALAARRNGTDQRCYVIVGDGEANEGTIWEAALFAAHADLSNLMVIVDANGWQAMGRTNDVLRLGNLAEKFAAFGWNAHECAGHDEAALERTIRELRADPTPRPKAIIAHTTKGHGVSFMADDNRWHYTRLTAETFAAAMTQVA